MSSCRCSGDRSTTFPETKPHYQARSVFCYTACLVTLHRTFFFGNHIFRSGFSKKASLSALHVQLSCSLERLGDAASHVSLTSRGPGTSHLAHPCGWKCLAGSVSCALTLVTSMAGTSPAWLFQRWILCCRSPECFTGPFSLFSGHFGNSLRCLNHSIWQSCVSLRH